MNENLRQKLEAAGVPRECHDAASLALYFPSEFRIFESNLDAAMLAEVLLTFLKHRLVSLDAERDPAVMARRALGRHLCHFYRGERELLELAGAFMKAGAEAGQRCYWVLPRRISPRAALQGLEAPLAAGTLSLLAETEVYLTASGALRDGREIVAFWLDREREARARGFSGLCVTGDGTGILASDQHARGAAYESAVDDAFAGRAVTALCTYSLERIAPARLISVLASHHAAVVQRGRDWQELEPGPGAGEALELLREAA